MTTPNIALLEATMAQIDAHPEHWKQEVWRCGTGMCFAGTAVDLNGRQWADKPDGDNGEYIVVDDPDAWGDDVDSEEVYDNEKGRYVLTGRTVVSAQDVAQRDLGLTHEQADALFNPDNTRDDLRQRVAALKAGEPITRKTPEVF